MSDPTKERPPDRWARIIIEAAVIGAVAAAAGLGVNLLRPDGLPLVAEQPYDIIVPCPEPLGEVFPADPRSLQDPDTLVIDARSKREFDRWHWQGAQNVVYRYIEPVPREVVSELVRSGAKRIIVYGDGDDPDTGFELARELAGRGARNVFYIEGGAPVLAPEEVNNDLL